MIYRGKVKWFNNTKGYGFIVCEGINEDLFVHYSAIKMEGYRTLRAGQLASFEVTPGANGLHAINVVIEQNNPSQTMNALDMLNSAAKQ